MSDHVSVSFDKAAFQRLKGLLGDLGPEVILRSMAATQRKQMKKIVEKAKAKAPKRSGALQSAIGMKVTAKKKTGELYAGAGVRSMTVYDIKTRKKINPARYSHLSEFGHAVRGRGQKGKKGTGPVIGQVAAQPFMRPAINEVAGNDLGLAVMIGDVEKAIERAAKRAKRKGGKR